MRLRGILDRPIAFHRCFVTLTGSIKAGLMLSQAVYWQLRNDDGWWFQSQDKWEDETGLTRTEQECARKRLRELGFWSEDHRGIPCKLYFKVDIDALEDALDNLQTSMQETCKQERRKPAHRPAENLQPPIKETSEETYEGVESTPPAKEEKPAVGVSDLFDDLDSGKLDLPPPPKAEVAPPPKPPRARNVLADTLATLNGEDLREVTRPQWSSIMASLKSIKDVCPDVTPDEIKRRVHRYRQLHPQWELTHSAIAKYWGSLSSLVSKPQPVKTGIPNICTYKPPTNG